jgi:hypothetical protein
MALVNATQLANATSSAGRLVHVGQAEAFHTWYQNSLSGAVATARAVPQTGLNWFFQNRTYPCADCCKCSVDMLQQLRRAHPGR